MQGTGPASAEYPYLRVDQYLRDMVSAQALAVAFQTGLVDYLLDHDSPGPCRLRHDLGMDESGFETLVNLLQASLIILLESDTIRLTDEFSEALQYRDLMETKLEYANRVAPDVLGRFHQYIIDMHGFMRDSGLFDLFNYGRCHELTPENLDATAGWVRYTTILSRYEAQPFMDNLHLSSHEKLLDVGGNSGEFALQLCRSNPGLKAGVFDLPVVCSLGERHLSEQPENQRIVFYSGDLQQDVLPDGFDLVLFKSFLHDWPADIIRSYLDKARTALTPGGKLVIFERSRILNHDHIAFGNLPVYLFQYFYREASFYVELLKELEFTGVQVKNIRLDTPFMLVSAARR